MMPSEGGLTLAQAQKVLAHATGWSDVDGFMRIYEAMLRSHGWTARPERSAEVERVRVQLKDVPTATRAQVLAELETQDGDSSFSTREIIERCRPVSTAQVRVVLHALHQDGRIEALEREGRWKRITGAELPGAGPEAVSPLVDTAQRVWHAWNVGDLDFVLAHCSHRILLRPRPGLTYEGHAGIRRFWAEQVDRDVTWTSTVRSWHQQHTDVLVAARVQLHTPLNEQDTAITCLFRFSGGEIALVQALRSPVEVGSPAAA
jgi:hypothetical protein